VDKCLKKQFRFLLTCFFHSPNHKQGNRWNDAYSKIRGHDMKNIGFSNLILILFCVAPCVHANPLGGVVGSGSASFSSAENTLTISQSSDTSIINWNTFSIANGESTVFEFNGAAGANSAVLNLVSAGNGGSTIAGSLSSTVGHLGPIGGTVLLLNPDGILFTPTATVNVGSLVATTLGLPDQNEFLNGTALHFSGTSTAGVAAQNGASLNALGDVFLIAHTVQNSGVISAGDEAGLAAGTTVTLAQSGLERLTVVAGTTSQEQQEQTPVGVDNTEAGKINAVVTELKAAGGNIYALAINNGGAVRATSLVNENGRIFFRATDSTGNQGAVSSTGTINVDGANVTAADVTMQGSQVTLGGTVNAGAGSVTVTTTSGNGVNGTGDIDVNDETDITAGSVSLHSGTDGAGDISFGGDVTVHANSQFYQAGIGDGSASTAVADLTDNNPVFLNQAGNGSPASFTFEQDATIVDADIPASSQFSSSTPPADYAIISDGGDLTLDTGSKVAGSDLTLDAAGTLTIWDNLNLNSLSASGNTIALNGTGGSETVTTTGAQTYNNDVTLGANTTLNGTSVTFEKTVNADLAANNRTLTINASGVTTFGGAVGNNQSLASLTTDAAGTTALNGGVLTATVADFKDDVILGANTTFNSPFLGTTVTFEKTVNADLAANNRALTIGSRGMTTFDGAVGNNQALASVMIIGLNETPVINGGSVTTIGAQSYSDNLTLGANTTLNGASLGLLGVTGGGHNLTLNNSGTATLGVLLAFSIPPGSDLIVSGPVIGVNTLTASGSGNLVVNNTISAGTFNDVETTTLNISPSFNGGLVTTTGAQNYNGNVTLGAATTLTSSGGADITFAKTVDGAQTLAVNTSGNEIFNGTVGGNTALTSLTTDGSGTVGGSALLNGGSVTTIGSQTYNDNVTLGANTTLSGTTLSLSGALAGGGNNLTLNNSGVATLEAVSGVNALNFTGNGNLVANGTISAGSLYDSEPTALNGRSVATTGTQTYANIVTLGANTTLSLSGLSFAGIGAISGNGYVLIINGVVYSVIGEDETLKRSMLGAILPTYQPIEVRARKPWLHKRKGLPPWSITDPMNSLQVPFD
jgi:filamentous hemagglutinin family protein